jgi:hypothetical protein
MLASIGLIAALAIDFLMTPVLVMITRPFGNER